MEKAFLNKSMTDNGFQDPMGNDAHQGLERFLDKFHQPTVPTHTIITDPEYYVFLWFHNSIGNLIYCPYTDWLRYTPRLDKSSVNFKTVNSSLYNQPGIQSGTYNLDLPDKCVDLTPFVREASLPEIAPANAEKIQTLFGETQAGAFSPYASDGSKSITLQMIDTEYCILDALFYPWMKDINSPWWYRPEMVYDEWATPYPMATLEIQRPRMRYRENAKAQDSRNDSDYTYYAYKFIGVKPTSYAAFEVNAAGRSNLLRQLTLVADMCLVDLTGDVAGSSSSSTNLGNRTKFIFSDSPTSSPEEQDEEDPDDVDDMEDELDDYEDELDDVNDDIDDNDDDIDQEDEGDMPGEDEEEWMDEDDEDYDPDEYMDDYGDEEMDDDEYDMDEDEEDPEDEEEEEEPQSLLDKIKDWVSSLFSSGDSNKDDGEDSQDEDMDDYSDSDQETSPDDSDEDDPNGDLSGYSSDNSHKEDSLPWGFRSRGLMEPQRRTDVNRDERESAFFDEVLSDMMDVGSDVATESSDNMGWMADGTNVGMGLNPSLAGDAVGVGAEIQYPSKETEPSKTGELQIVASVKHVTGGPASELLATVLNEIYDIKGHSVGIDGKAHSLGSSAAVGGGDVKQMVDAIFNSNTEVQYNKTGTFNALGKALKGAQNMNLTAFGVVYNAPSTGAMQTEKGTSNLLNETPQDTSDMTTLVGGVISQSLSTSFASVGQRIGQAGNVMGDSMNRLSLTGETRKVDIEGAMREAVTSGNLVKQVGRMSKALTTASNEICDNMEFIGEFCQTVLKAGKAITGSGVIGRFGQIVSRIVTSNGNKPTPIENYVTMVTKKSAKSSTDA